MHYRPAVTFAPILPQLSPFWTLLFVAIFITVALAVRRRPAFAIVALCVAIPFDGAHLVAGTTLTFGKTALLAAITGLIGRTGVRFSRATQRVALVLVVVVVATAASAFSADDRGLVLHETLKWSEYALVFLTVAAAYTTDSDDVLVRRALFGAAAVVCATALFQLLLGAPSAIAVGPGIVPRLAGALEGPNQLAGYLEIAIATAVAWSSRGRASGPTLVLFAFTLALTFSRGGMLAATAGCVAVVLVSGMRPVTLALWPVLTGGLLGAAADGMLLWAAFHLSAFRNDAYGTDAAGGVGTRAQLWRAAWFFIRHHPLLGIGAGNFERELPQAGLVGIRTHANSWYLQSFAEGGIVLFSATLAFIAVAIATMWRRVRSSPWALAAFGATIALVLHQVADDLVFFPKVAEPWMIVLALGAASSPSRD